MESTSIHLEIISFLISNYKILVHIDAYKFSLIDEILLLLAGFGNVQGNAELWDIKGKKKIKKIEIPDTTFLQWSPDGQHFVTATTAPRLKVSNGYKIWHSSGSLLHEKPWKNDELFQVVWQNYSQGTFKMPTIVYKAVEGISSSQPIGKLIILPSSLYFDS